MHQSATLPNGIRILTATMPHVRSVSIAFFFCAGSRYECAEQSGVSHLIEHMLFKGSERFPTAQVISEAIEGVGGLLDAGTDKELTVYSVKIASRHFDLAMGLLADMVRWPRFEEAELDKERRVIIEELGMYRDSPQDWVSVLGDETVWPDLPLGREVAGTRETVEGIARETVAGYWRGHYVPGNLVVSIAGDVEHERVVACVAELLGDWEARDVPRWEPCPPPVDAPRVRLEQRKTEQTNLALYTLGIPHRDRDEYTMPLLNAVLGDGMSSRLFLEVRERQGLAYDVGSSPVSYHDTGVMVVSAGVEPRRARAALKAILAQLRRVRDEAVGEEELRRAKEYTKGRMALRLEDTGSVAHWLGGQEALLGDVRELDETLERIDEVTSDDIQRLARTIFRDEWLRLALIGPHKDAAMFERALHL
ncbi:MAG: M16 family peptidase [Ktedonobacterales bacterium]|jgi:predicted Zn-dependent peptidase|nr:MAG: M16 family peptidase [Ktedonobacterales bacterium]